jgi:hypothetical protein
VNRSVEPQRVGSVEELTRWYVAEGGQASVQTAQEMHAYWVMPHSVSLQHTLPMGAENGAACGVKAEPECLVEMPAYQYMEGNFAALKAAMASRSSM